MQLSIKIDANIYNLLKKIKERDGVPMAVCTYGCIFR